VNRMKVKKYIAIGIIALFLGISTTPMISATSEPQKSMIPIQLMVQNPDGSIGQTSLSFDQGQLQELMDLMDALTKTKNRDGILERIQDFLRHSQRKDLKDLFDFNLIGKLPGDPIVSIGENRDHLTKYHGRLQFKKLFSAWHYPDGLSSTIIWGNGLTSQPTQILLKRQFGFMVGFVGIYMYIPPLLEGMNGRTLAIGSSLFAWGISL